MLDSPDRLEKSGGKLHSESESEEFLQASTLTLVPESEEDYVNVVRRDSKPSNGQHDYENVSIIKEQNCTKLENKGSAE